MGADGGLFSFLETPPKRGKEMVVGTKRICSPYPEPPLGGTRVCLAALREGGWGSYIYKWRCELSKWRDRKTPESGGGNLKF